MLKFSDTDSDPGSEIFLTRDPGWKIRIRDKHPGSATLGRRCHYVFQFIYFILFLLLSFYTECLIYFRRLCRWFHAEREPKKRKTLILRRAAVKPAYIFFPSFPSDTKMGVLGLWSLLEPVGKPVPVESLGMSLIWYRYCCWFCLITFGFSWIFSSVPDPWYFEKKTDPDP